jgi:acyl-coenzyme A thioesterase PaaI-like protein
MPDARWIDALRNGPGEGSFTLPYAATLRLTYVREPSLVITMPFNDDLIGSPGRLHGGTVAGLLEIAALATLGLALEPGDTPRLKPVSVTVDYMREGKPVATFAAATITRLGRRVANLRAEAWQDDPARPIAAAHSNILLDRG